MPTADANDALRKSLENGMDGLHLWLLWWTALVVVGLVLEYGFEFGKHRIAPHLSSRLSWLFPLGAILVTLGVAGELYVEFRASSVETNLRNLNNRTIAELRKTAADAELVAAQLRLAISDRDLNPEQQRRIGAALRTFAGKVVYLRSYAGDREAARLIIAIKSALGLAGVRTEDRTGELKAMFDSPETVFGIRVQPGRMEDSFGRAVVAALRSEGTLSVSEPSAVEHRQSLTEIHVGIKPIQLEAHANQKFSATDAQSARHLSGDAILRLRAALLPFKAQLVTAIWDVNDTEIDEFANDVAHACCMVGTAQWQMNVSMRGAKADVFGIVVLVRPDADEPSREAASALANALRHERLTVLGPQNAESSESFIGPARPQDSAVPAAPVTIVIGKKR